jgi:single-stranded DNA-specific DHH superfamily exonuclease
MALTGEQCLQIRNELAASKKPLIFFHDDADGLTSFLLLYRFRKTGKGIMVKSTPKVDKKYLHYVEEYAPDKIFIVDVAVVEQEFIDKSKKPAVWIDHHQPLKRKGVLYFNPRISNISDSYPASYICYKAVKRDLWIAMIGIVGDWHMPEFSHEFAKKYPDLLSANTKKPEEALFTTKLGELVRIFSFVLKGTSEEAMKCVRILTRIESPYEILNQETARGRYIYKRYSCFNKMYQQLLAKVKKVITKDDFAIFTYRGKDSFTGELANELLYLYPEKVIIVGREKEDEIRMSLRGAGKNTILPRLQRALRGINGYGGGHEYACGASVKKYDFDKFIQNLRKEF